MDTNEDQLVLPGFDDLVTPTTVVDRHMHSEGLLLATLEHAMRWDATQKYFPYQIDIRRAGGRSGETLIVFKAVVYDEPRIAFHSDVGMIGTLRTFIGRLRAGKLTFKLDERPGALLDKVLPEIDYWKTRFSK